MYGYVRNIHPRLCKNARGEGVVVVGEQMIAPAAIERQQAQYQQERWPGWENPVTDKAFDLVQENEQKTWATCVMAKCTMRRDEADTNARGRVVIIDAPLLFRPFGDLVQT